MNGEELAREAMRRVRESSDPTADLETQKRLVAGRLIFGFGSLVSQETCWISRCNATQVQRRDGPILWIYTSKQEPLEGRSGEVASIAAGLPTSASSLPEILIGRLIARGGSHPNATEAPTSIESDSVAVWERLTSPEPE